MIISHYQAENRRGKTERRYVSNVDVAWIARGAYANMRRHGISAAVARSHVILLLQVGMFCSDLKLFPAPLRPPSGQPVDLPAPKAA